MSGRGLGAWPSGSPGPCAAQAASTSTEYEVLRTPFNSDPTNTKQSKRKGGSLYYVIIASHTLRGWWLCRASTALSSLGKSAAKRGRRGCLPHAPVLQRHASVKATSSIVALFCTTAITGFHYTQPPLALELCERLFLRFRQHLMTAAVRKTPDYQFPQRPAFCFDDINRRSPKTTSPASPASPASPTPISTATLHRYSRFSVAEGKQP